jgi:hypothetical protein
MRKWSGGRPGSGAPAPCPGRSVSDLLGRFLLLLLVGPAALERLRLGHARRAGRGRRQAVQGHAIRRSRVAVLASDTASEAVGSRRYLVKHRIRSSSDAVSSERRFLHMAKSARQSTDLNPSPGRARRTELARDCGVTTDGTISSQVSDRSRRKLAAIRAAVARSPSWSLPSMPHIFTNRSLAPLERATCSIMPFPRLCAARLPSSRTLLVAPSPLRNRIDACCRSGSALRLHAGQGGEPA